jgi:hypothetical protein
VIAAAEGEEEFGGRGGGGGDVVGEFEDIVPGVDSRCGVDAGGVDGIDGDGVGVELGVGEEPGGGERGGGEEEKEQNSKFEIRMTNQIRNSNEETGCESGLGHVNFILFFWDILNFDEDPHPNPPPEYQGRGKRVATSTSGAFSVEDGEISVGHL